MKRNKVEGEARMEIMSRHDIIQQPESKVLGYAYLAISVGDKLAIISLTEQFDQDGYGIYSESRTTGDGYFESVSKDPEGNLIEITC